MVERMVEHALSLGSEALEEPKALSAESLTGTSTDKLKALLLKLVSDRDGDPIAKKVRFLNEHLFPLFQELERRNPTPDVVQQVPLVQGIWRSVWSTIPFQDILPGRVRDQSYQIFASNGLYANMARYRLGHKQPPLLSWLNWVSRWLLSYDLMILQTYAVSENLDAEGDSDALLQSQQWNIQNVGIRQVLHFGPAPFDAQAANAWFQKAMAKYQQSPSAQAALIAPTTGMSRAMEKKYEKVSQAQPVLEHLYIDSDFRLVKSLREKNQRPSYTVAVRVPEAGTFSPR
jgi:hypothetical protein